MNAMAFFPPSYEEIIQLKGIGPYTAAAIASFAFKEIKPAIDGNVYRVPLEYLTLKRLLMITDLKNILSNYP